MSLPSESRGITLIELIIAAVLLSVIVMGLSSINIFSHFHVLNSDRRAKIQNEASLVLEYMSKEIGKAIGNETIEGADSVVNRGNIAGNSAIRVFIDSDADGKKSSAPPDRWIAYRFSGATGVPATQYQIWYCPLCTDDTCVACNPAWGSADNTITKNISSFTPGKPVNASNQLNKNFVTVGITACWDPASSESVDNPCVRMNASFQMPSVSAN